MPEKPIAAMIEKIAKECEETNADSWTITKIVKELSKQQATNMRSLRKEALKLLQQLDPKAASIYASFQKMQVRTSKQAVEGFDRGNIIKSLLRETSVPRGVAEKIGREVEEKIKDLEIESISTALIRELVNVKLLEYGHENVRNQYTRLGLPVFEAEKKAAKMPYSNRAIMSEFNLLRVIPPKHARMHLENEIFIAALEDFCTKPVATSLAAKQADNAKESVFAILERLNRLERLFSWRPNISALNLAVAGGSKKVAGEAAILFSRGAKACFLNGKAVPAFNTVFLFEPEQFSKSRIDRESMYTAANSIVKSASEERFPCFESCVALDSKYKLKALNEFPKTFLNCKSREFNLVNGVAFEGKGLCSFTGLNLSAMALANKREETGFFEELEKKAKAVAQLDEAKRKALAGRDYLGKQGIVVSEQRSALALDSLVEASRIVVGSEKDSEALAFAERVLSELKKSLPEQFVVTELKNKAASHRFSQHNRKSFGAKPGQAEEESLLKKNEKLCKNYCFAAKAGSLKELAELIESNVRLVEFAGND
jgi:hypothetical protein